MPQFHLPSHIPCHQPTELEILDLVNWLALRKCRTKELYGQVWLDYHNKPFEPHPEHWLDNEIAIRMCHDFIQKSDIVVFDVTAQQTNIDWPHELQDEINEVMCAFWYGEPRLFEVFGWLGKDFCQLNEIDTHVRQQITKAVFRKD